MLASWRDNDVYLQGGVRVKYVRNAQISTQINLWAASYTAKISIDKNKQKSHGLTLLFTNVCWEWEWKVCNEDWSSYWLLKKKRCV